MKMSAFIPVLCVLLLGMHTCNCESTSSVKISEIMYNPSSVPDASGEYVEITNFGDEILPIDDWEISDGSDMPAVQIQGAILPGESFVICRERSNDLNGGFDCTVFFQFMFTLDNDEELLVLFNSDGSPVDAVNYRSGGEWPHCGAGVSIERISPDLPGNDPNNWKCAEEPYGLGDLGTPGE